MTLKEFNETYSSYIKSSKYYKAENDGVTEYGNYILGFGRSGKYNGKSIESYLYPNVFPESAKNSIIRGASASICFGFSGVDVNPNGLEIGISMWIPKFLINNSDIDKILKGKG